MGIRIHKRMGYGLADVKHNTDGEITDKRFNLKDGWFNLSFEQKEKKSFKKFEEHLKNVVEKDKKENGCSSLFLELITLKENKFDFVDLIHHDSEFGISKIVLFQTFYKDWSRYDDIIDYMEAKDCTSTYKMFNKPIYPYDSWINIKTGLPYIEVDGTKLMCHDLLRNINYFKTELYSVKHLGYESAQELKKDIVPMVPEIIKEYCKFLKVFNDEETVKTLKPMTYTYWS
jgi:hypothetical protein